MIKIIKNGNPNKHAKTIFTTTCFVCGCEFEYEYSDIDKSINGTIEITCPCCNKHLGLTNKRIKERIEVVENE